MQTQAIEVKKMEPMAREIASRKKLDLEVDRKAGVFVFRDQVGAWTILQSKEALDYFARGLTGVSSRSSARTGKPAVRFVRRPSPINRTPEAIAKEIYAKHPAKVRSLKDWFACGHGVFSHKNILNPVSPSEKAWNPNHKFSETLVAAQDARWDDETLCGVTGHEGGFGAEGGYRLGPSEDIRRVYAFARKGAEPRTLFEDASGGKVAVCSLAFTLATLGGANTFRRAAGCVACFSDGELLALLREI